MLQKLQGYKKVPSSCQGLVNFPARQVHVTFHLHLPHGQGHREAICQVEVNNTKVD